MSQASFYCNHCGNHFQAEEKEGLECPRCFWSSSVQIENETQEKKSAPISKPKPSMELPLWLLPVFTFLIIFSLCGGGLYFVYSKGFFKQIQGWRLSEKKSTKTEIPLNPQIPGEQPGAHVQPISTAQDPAFQNLSAEEKEQLTRVIQVSPKESLTEEEQKILQKPVAFKTGWNETLPSQPWSIESFKKMLDEQEDFFKVPLPGSYRKKLERHFEEHYLAGKTAFEQGDMLGARNHWVDALQIPQYSDKIERHRGVALTMLRPFITDTLSKIGAINNSLLEEKIRGKEQQVTENYQKLLAALKNQQWKDATSLIATIHQRLDQLENPEATAGQAPPYPPSIAQIDEGIRLTLIDLLDMPPPPVTAFDELRTDLAEKNKIVNGFIPERFEEMQGAYQEGLRAIQEQDWKKADLEFRKVIYPADLAQDAETKRAVLKKLQRVHEEAAKNSETPPT